MRDGPIPGGGTGPGDPGPGPNRGGGDGGGKGGGEGGGDGNGNGNGGGGPGRRPPDNDYRKGTRPLLMALWVVGVLILAGMLALAIRVSNTPPPVMPPSHQADPYR